MKYRKMTHMAVVVFLLLVFFTICGFDQEKQRVFDDAGLFTEGELTQLELECEKAVSEGQLDIVIVTVNSIGQKSAMEYADDFYDEGNFGYGDNTGILLLIDMGDRQVWISTAGEAIDYFTDSRIDAMLDDITDELSEGNYAEGAEAFIEDSVYYMNLEPDEEEWDTQYVYDDYGYSSYGAGAQPSSYGSSVWHRLFVALVAGMIISGITVSVMYVQEKGRMTADAHTYLKDNRYDVRNRQDIFINTTTVTHVVNDTSSSYHRSGGHHTSSHTHTSRGGVHHGGGGRHF